MKSFAWVLIIIAFTSCIWRGAVYEARSSEDVVFYLAHNPEENGALMFYDLNQEKNDEDVTERVNKILGIFKNIGEEGRSTEDWVNSLNDKVHLMRINAKSSENSKIVDEYKVQSILIIINNFERF